MCKTIFKDNTQEKFEGTKAETRNHQSKKKHRQNNGQMKRDNRTHNDLQNTTEKPKDWATRTPLSCLRYDRGVIRIVEVGYIADHY